MGSAKSYVDRIYKEFNAAGYNVRHILLDAQYMGVPQRRARVFFLAFREDLAPIKQPLKVYSNIRVATAKEVSDYQGREIKSTIARWLWEHRAVGDRTQADASVRQSNDDTTMTAQEIQQEIGRLREEQKITKYRVIKDGVMSGTTAITNFESGAQTAQITTIERNLDYLGYKLEIVPK